MRIYFAHVMADYDTPKEQAALKAIRKRYPKAVIVNPNQRRYSEGYKKRGSFQYFVELVQSCDLVVAMPFDDGEWGMGIWREVEAAADKGIETLEYHKGNWSVASFRAIRPLSIDQTSARNRAVRV